MYKAPSLYTNAVSTDIKFLFVEVKNNILSIFGSSVAVLCVPLFKSTQSLCLYPNLYSSSSVSGASCLFVSSLLSTVLVYSKYSKGSNPCGMVTDSFCILISFIKVEVGSSTLSFLYYIYKLSPL